MQQRETQGEGSAAQVLALYRKRLEETQKSLSAMERRAKRFSNYRLFAFLLVIGSGIFALWVDYAAALGGVAAALVALIVIIVWHEILLRRVVEAKRCVQYWNDCVDRVNHRWIGRGISGENYLDEHHLYAADLDLFGKGSLFELLCSARTALGERALASWLLKPAAPETAAERQGAVRELAPNHRLREDLAMLGPDVRAYVHPDALSLWGERAVTRFSGAERLLTKVVPAVTLIAAVLTVVFAMPYSLLAIALLAQVGVAYHLRQRVQQVITHVDFAARDLEILALVLHRFEAQQFHSPLLVGLRRKLEAGGDPPSRRIAKLSRLSELLDSRLNQAFAVIAPILLWTTNCAIAIEAWRAENGPHLGEWLEAIGDLEALCSLSRYAFEHPADAWPEFVPGTKLYESQGLAHPLIEEGAAVRNDVSLGADAPLLIVSGSNMSGKSTLLRSVGLSVVLALAGAPVRARSVRLSPFALGASIRVTDNLQEGESRFYAEIRRVRDILDLAESAPAALFLLDEIFSGTNSHDRRIGAQAILRSLVERGAVGLVTTHDLALTRIEETLGGRARNVHFEDEIVDGRVKFDYRMREGVVTRSNALELMRSIGIEL